MNIQIDQVDCSITSTKIPNNPLRGAIRPDFIRDETLAEIFASTAAHLGNNTALIEGDRRLTYRNVDDESNLIARGLVARGVGDRKSTRLNSSHG